MYSTKNLVLKYPPHNFLMLSLISLDYTVLLKAGDFMQSLFFFLFFFDDKLLKATLTCTFIPIGFFFIRQVRDQF